MANSDSDIGIHTRQTVVLDKLSLCNSDAQSSHGICLQQQMSISFHNSFITFSFLTASPMGLNAICCCNAIAASWSTDS